MLTRYPPSYTYARAAMFPFTRNAGASITFLRYPSTVAVTAILCSGYTY